MSSPLKRRLKQSPPPSHNPHSPISLSATSQTLIAQPRTDLIRICDTALSVIMTSSQSETSSSKKSAKRSSYQRQKAEDNSPTQYKFFSESGTTYRPFTDPKRIANNDAKRAASSDLRKCVKGVPDHYLGVMNTASNECTSSASLEHALPGGVVAPKEHANNNYDFQLRSEQSGTAEALSEVQMGHHSPSDTTEFVISDTESSHLSLPWHLTIPSEPACFGGANHHDHHVYSSQYAKIGSELSPTYLEAPQACIRDFPIDNCLEISSRYSFNPGVHDFIYHASSGYDSPTGSSESSSSHESPSSSGSPYALTPFSSGCSETGSVSFATNMNGSLLAKSDLHFLTGPDTVGQPHSSSFSEFSAEVVHVDDPILDVMNLGINLQLNDLLCLNGLHSEGLVGFEGDHGMFVPNNSGYTPL